MMMLEITMEVSVNIDLPLKGRAQAWLGHSWALLGTLGHFWELLESFTFRHRDLFVLVKIYHILGFFLVVVVVSKTRLQKRCTHRTYRWTQTTKSSLQ